MNFNPFPEIKTERLSLRKINIADCDAILFLRSDKTVNKFIERPENRKTKNRTDAIKFIKELDEGIKNNNTIAWGISLKDNHNIIGTICLWNFSKDRKTAEVGYDLNPEFHKKGMMSEALKNVIHFGFIHLKLNKIEAYTHIKNENSRKLLVKNDFHIVENKNDENNVHNLIFEIKKVSKQQSI